jgi:hypothetical protein
MEVLKCEINSLIDFHRLAGLNMTKGNVLNDEDAEISNDVVISYVIG